VHDDRRWVTLLVGSDPRHQHDVAWGWAEALMTIRFGTLRRSDRVSEPHYTETEPIVTAERQSLLARNQQVTPRGRARRAMSVTDPLPWAIVDLAGL
jgi:hypothetical protein